jgi:hypothetical protein
VQNLPPVVRPGRIGTMQSVCTVPR